MGMMYDPLTREEMISVIEGRGDARRVPVMAHFWVHPETFGEKEAKVREILAKYPQDAQVLTLRTPQPYLAPEDAPDYRWMNIDDPYEGTSTGLDERIAITDWAQLDGILKDFPDPEYPGLCRDIFIDEPSSEADGRYRIGHWWFSLFEMHWFLRGMTNALTDYYAQPEEVHRYFRALTDFYKRVFERGREELNLDAFLISDDLGTQTGTFFSEDLFDEFFAPYYRELFDKCHELGMHMWLHACGNIERILPRFFDMDLDVIHPIQKGAMDQVATAGKYGGQIAFWAGLDVQQVIPWGTPDEVRQEVRTLIDAFWRDGEGRMILTAGNGINGDCPLDSLDAFLQEAVEYGTAKIASQPVKEGK
jgi:hypothetical protein